MSILFKVLATNGISKGFVREGDGPKQRLVAVLVCRDGTLATNVCKPFGSLTLNSTDPHLCCHCQSHT